MFLSKYQGKRILDKNNLVGAAQLAGGTYLGYQGIKHGLPRALGLRIEYHTTSKSNADLIKKSGNFLDPKFGGKNGYAQKGANFSFMLNGCKSKSENYVHITGLHKDSKFNSIVKNKKWLTPPLRTIYRKTQNVMYRTLELLNAEKCVAPTNIKEGLKNIGKLSKNIFLPSKSKKFCIAGTDSYFYKNFIPDSDDIALKTKNKIKVYDNRFSATITGLKEFGLKGMKENKGRVAFGVGLLALGTYGVIKLFRKGVNNICKT